MGCHKIDRTIPAELRRMMEVVALIIDRHPVGIRVIEGREELESEDIAAMYELARAKPIRGKDPLNVQSFKSAAEVESYFERYKTALPQAAALYAKEQPRKYAVLREIGLSGHPRARSKERIARAHGIDPKTLYSWKFNSIKSIALTALSLRETSLSTQ